jgi:hypothetical protein
MAMALTARERVARLLDDDDTPGAFSTRFTMEPRSRVPGICE